MDETELTAQIEALQGTIRKFVSDIGYDVEKFTKNCFTTERVSKRRHTDSASHTPAKPAQNIKPKIKALYKIHGITSDDCNSAFSLLPPAGKLELYEALVEINNSQVVDCTKVDDMTDIEEVIKQQKEDKKEKSRLELIKLQRDSKRRRRKFKCGKVHVGNKTIMDKHRLLVNGILQEYTESLDLEVVDEIKS